MSRWKEHREIAKARRQPRQHMNAEPPCLSCGRPIVGDAVAFDLTRDDGVDAVACVHDTASCRPPAGASIWEWLQSKLDPTLHVIQNASGN